MAYTEKDLIELDLREGDIVELADTHYPGVTVRGPALVSADGSIQVGSWFVRVGYQLSNHAPLRTIAVIERAPRPLFVNNPRDHIVAGDIFRDSDGVVQVANKSRSGSAEPILWHHDLSTAGGPDWRWKFSGGESKRGSTLLVDGTTGKAVTE